MKELNRLTRELIYQKQILERWYAEKEIVDTQITRLKDKIKHYEEKITIETNKNGSTE